MYIPTTVLILLSIYLIYSGGSDHKSYDDSGSYDQSYDWGEQ